MSKISAFMQQYVAAMRWMFKNIEEKSWEVRYSLYVNESLIIKLADQIVFSKEADELSLSFALKQTSATVWYNYQIFDFMIML